MGSCYSATSGEQFEFFIGDWDCELRVHQPGTETPTTLRGEWRAKWLHDRRILMDDLSVLLPGGEEILGWVNLRTYSAESGHWEITGQRVLEPASGALTAGRWRDGEMHLTFETGIADRPIQHRVRPSMETCSFLLISACRWFDNSVCSSSSRSTPCERLVASRWSRVSLLRCFRRW